jgi:prolycopene isomerase
MAARPNKANMQAKVAHYKTAVPNLFLSGHWAEYGGGVPIAVKAGSNAALLVLKQEKPAAFAALAQVMDKPDRRGSYRPGFQA